MKLIKQTITIVTLYALTVFSHLAHANFDYTLYEGNFDEVPDFSLLLPDSSGQTTVISPNVTALTDNFALVFNKTISIETAGNYSFSTTSDDGSKLYIDDVLLVDNDGIHNVTTVTGEIFLEPGEYSLRVEYFEATGGQTLTATFAFEGDDPQAIPASGFLGLVANDTDFVNDDITLELDPDSFNYSLYEGAFSALPDFNTLSPFMPKEIILLVQTLTTVLNFILMELRL